MTSPPLEDTGKRTFCISSNPLDIQNAIRGAIQFATVPSTVTDRRAQERTAYTRLFPLTPVNNAEEMIACGETIQAAGKNLSPGGIGFFHQEAIPSRYVVISLQQSQDTFSQYLVKISWCRFLHTDWYDSGGQIIRMVKWDE